MREGVQNISCSGKDKRQWEQLQKKINNGKAKQKHLDKFEKLDKYCKTDDSNNTPYIDNPNELFHKASKLIQVYDAPVHSYGDEIENVLLHSPILKLTRNTYPSAINPVTTELPQIY